MTAQVPSPALTHCDACGWRDVSVEGRYCSEACREADAARHIERWKMPGDGRLKAGTKPVLDGSGGRYKTAKLGME